MSVEAEKRPASWLYESDRESARPARRLRGLRFPVLPSGAWLAQVGGGLAAMSGCFLQFGTSVTLMVGGGVAVVLGALREAGKV